MRLYALCLSLDLIAIVALPLIVLAVLVIAVGPEVVRWLAQ
mgnify:CR=1 FL=1